MERLRKKDAEEGIVERPLTDEQKAAIADARSFCDAKLAELRILHAPKLVAAVDPAVRQQLEEEYRRDVHRITDERDRKIARIRQ
jgi:hypothetical protein